jgi:CotH kinase protein
MPRPSKWTLLALVTAIFCAGAALWADSYIKAHDHPGLCTFLVQWWRNYPKSLRQELPVLRITVDEKGMQELEAVVQRAKQLGVVPSSGNNYVKAKFTTQEGDFKGKLRIKGKMTDHVQGSKWSLRVVAGKQGGFLGMRRFSLQHPGTRNYLADLFFHRLMAREGIVALRYGFCKVVLNGDDLGVYAYEEHFGQELLEHNGRLPGPIVRFDPSLFWVHRTDALLGEGKVADAYGAYQAAAVDAFDSEEIAADPIRREQFEKCVALLQSFRQGRIAASSVFDVERTAKRLAMLDLVGGHRSMDWSDVKFYYDPMAQRLEPISYESCSVTPLQELAAAYRVSAPFAEGDELNTALFKDTAIFGAYVKHLERFAQAGYLDSAFGALGAHLDTASAMLYREFPYKELNKGLYYANQRAITKLLYGPKALHAFTQPQRGDTIVIALQPIEALPMRVDHLLLASGERLRPLEEIIVPARPRASVGRVVLARFIGTEGDTATHVACRVLGSSAEHQVPISPWSLLSAQDADLLADLVPNTGEFSFLATDQVARTVTIIPGNWRLHRTLVLPPGYRCMATSPLRLDLAGSSIVSQGPIHWKGQEGSPIVLVNSTQQASSIQVLGARGASSLVRVHTEAVGECSFTFHASDVYLEECFFQGTGGTLLEASMANVQLVGTVFRGGKDPLRLDYAHTTIEGCVLERAQDDALVAQGGTLIMQRVRVEFAGGAAVKLTHKARCDAHDVFIEQCAIGYEMLDGARLLAEGGGLRQVGRIALAAKRSMVNGAVRMEFNGVEGAVPQAPFEIGEGGLVRLDGGTLPMSHKRPKP